MVLAIQSNINLMNYDKPPTDIDPITFTTDQDYFYLKRTESKDSRTFKNYQTFKSTCLDKFSFSLLYVGLREI